MIPLPGGYFAGSYTVSFVLLIGESYLELPTQLHIICPSVLVPELKTHTQCCAVQLLWENAVFTLEQQAFHSLSHVPSSHTFSVFEAESGCELIMLLGPGLEFGW